MTTDVHQQRLDKPRQDKGRRCDGCGVALYEFESAAFSSVTQRYERVDRCMHCCIYGPPRRPEGSPPSVVPGAAGRVALRHPDGTPKTHDEILNEVARRR